jgi:hypothetical protein
MFMKLATSLNHTAECKNRTRLCRAFGWTIFVALTFSFCIPQCLLASEDAPRRPFAQWAEVPEKGQFIWGTLYEQSEAYYMWEGLTRHNITLHTPDGESYGIDIRQGYFTLEYGITGKWAADVNFGATTVGWRSFDPNGGIQETTGLMDTAFGVRYQAFNEAVDTNSPWIPTLTFRAGAVVPGSYDRYLAFAPGNHSVAIEPSILVRKHFGWPGLGAWGDAWYRWMHTTGNDQYMASFGLFQQFGPSEKMGKWELDVGFRHQQATSGEDIILFGTGVPYDSISYKSNVREISETFVAGFSYTTLKRHIRYGFESRKTFEGRNTDSKLWLGGYLDIPFGGKKAKEM